MHFNSKPVDEHAEVPLADQGRLEKLSAVWLPQEQQKQGHAGRCYIISIALKQECVSASRTQEIKSLVQTMGNHVVGYQLIRISRPQPHALIGPGHAQDIGNLARACNAEILIVDAYLSPSQTRNLEEATGLSVRDRESVILNVFQKHIKTKKAKIQVEIAHLQYLRPRIRGLGLEMDQQAGGIIGGKGAGETASELLARQLDGRLKILQKEFRKIVKEGTLQRSKRKACKKIALVGYTNAGKTTIMNALTHAGLSAANQLFETLDTTSRALSRHGTDVLISDTVGFIRELPPRLLASFETTLAEIKEASLLAMVVDISDEEFLLHLQTTEHILKKLGVDRIPRFYIFHKSDKQKKQLSIARLRSLSLGHPWLLTSNQNPNVMTTLKKSLLHFVRKAEKEYTLLIPYPYAAAMDLIYSKTRIIHSKPLQQGLLFTFEAEKRWFVSLQNLLKKGPA